MTYSIGEVADRVGITISTLRYYDKEGVLPKVNRTAGNIRVFNEDDIESLKVIECLKNTGLQLKDIKLFFEWCKEGDSTIEKRYELFLHQKEETLKQIEQLKKSLNHIEYKLEYYKIAKQYGTTNVPGIHETLNTKFYPSDN